MTPLEQIPALVDRMRRELELARFIGKLVVERGVEEARTRLDRAVSVPSVDKPDDDATAPVRAGKEPMATTTDLPHVADLALADYDQLPSAHIVAKLDGLDAAERDAIETYERSGRHRRTILGKLERLRQAPEA